MTTPRKLSLREAAKIAGKGKTTISASIQDGRLVAARNDAGGYEIDPAELHRVFPLKVDPETGGFVEQRTPRDSRIKDDEVRPFASLALSRPSTRTGRAGAALTQAEQELREALRQLDQLKQDHERDQCHAQELAQKEIHHLRQTIDTERVAKAELDAAHEAHLRDLRRELEQVRAMLPAPEAPGPSGGWWARLRGQ